MPDPNPDEKKVKELLDSAERADLERWFGLPSFEQVAEREAVARPATEDPEFAARRKRQEDAVAAVDPRMLEARVRRGEAMAAITRPLPPIALRVETALGRLDEAMLDNRFGVAEPREYERPGDLPDALSERTPQALLRDLHRPELDFRLRFERVDMIEEFRIDVAGDVSALMKTSMKLPPAEVTPLQEARQLLRELRDERHQPWINIEMPLRRVTE
jgi:hypothetical protein